MDSCEQGTIQGSFLSEGSATLCWPWDDSTHRDNGCEAADRLKSSHSLFHGNWLVHPSLQPSSRAWEHLPFHTALPGMYFKLHSYRHKFKKPESCRERECRRVSSAGEFLLLPPPDQDWYGVFSVGYLPCYMLSIQLGVTTVNAVQNPLEKSAVVKV